MTDKNPRARRSNGVMEERYSFLEAWVISFPLVGAPVAAAAADLNPPLAIHNIHRLDGMSCYVHLLHNIDTINTDTTQKWQSGCASD
ncbi:hypothetical protein Pcinc_023888 [Petrolisthes cinctipes]|uniref:Uncharacterized protein n=1 Tax=Petrolisthes cinctipes TaxID=88211 RepID=A0AAE1FD81_PETCI|nr:hypothetical protein Pcinc_023888 [Petrolisthes cinctipes]